MGLERGRGLHLATPHSQISSVGLERGSYPTLTNQQCGVGEGAGTASSYPTLTNQQCWVGEGVGTAFVAALAATFDGYPRTSGLALVSPSSHVALCHLRSMRNREQ